MTFLWSGLQTPWGKDRLAELVTRGTAHTGIYRAQIEGLHGILPFSIMVDRFTLSDEHGTWLEGRKAKISLNPRALLSGIIEMKWFRMETLSIFRIPVEDKSKKNKHDDERESRIFLPRFTVQEMGINQIELDRAVTGTPLTYSLRSKMDTIGSCIRGRLALEDLRNIEDELRLEGIYDLEKERLSAQLTYHEMPGGLLSGLTQLKDARGIRLDLVADGPLSGIKGHLKLSAGGYGHATFSYKLALDQAASISLRGRIDAQKGTLPPKMAAALGGSGVDINCRATISQEQRLNIAAFEAQARSTSISLSGTVDLMKDIMDVQVEANPLNITPFVEHKGIAFRDLETVQIRAKGPFREPEVLISTGLGELGTAHGVFKQLSFTAQGTLIKFFHGLRQARISVLSREAALSHIRGISGPVRMDLVAKSPDFTAFWIENLRVTANELDVRVEDAQVDTDSGHFSGTAHALVRRLQPLMPSEMRDMDAKLKAQILATGNYLTMPIDTEISAVISDLTGLPPEVSKAIGPTLTLNARASLMGGTLNIRDACVKAGDGSLKMDGIITNGTGNIDVQYQLDVNALKTLTGIAGRQLAGNLESHGRVKGKIRNFDADIGLESKYLQLGGLTTQNLHARIKAKGLPQNPAGSLDFTGAVRGQQMALKTDFAWSGKTLAFSQTRASMPGIQLNATFDIAPSKGPISGTARGDIESFNGLNALLGIDVKGRGKFSLKAFRDKGGTGATMDAHFMDLEHETHRISDLTLNAVFTDLNAFQGHLDLSAKDIALKSCRLDTLTLAAKGTPENAEIDLKTRGSTSRTGMPDKTDTPVALSMHLIAQYGDAWRFRLDQLHATYEDLKVILPSPATVTMDNNRFALDHLTLDTTTGRLRAKGELNQEKIDFSARIEHIPLALLEPLIHQDLSGTATVNVDLSGALADPAVQVKVHVRDYTIPRAEDLEPMVLEAKVDAKRQEERFLLNGVLLGLGDTPFTITASIPGHLSLKPLGFHLDKTADMNGELKGHLDLAFLKTLPSMDHQDLTGLVDFDLGIAGTIDKWALTGGASLSRGRYENVAIGMILDNIQGRLNADQQNLRLTQLTATDGAKGAITLEGDVNMSPSLPINARLSLNQAALIRKEIFTSTTSGKIDLRGNKDKMDLTGEIILDRTELTIPRRLPPSVVEIPVNEINLPNGMAAKESQPSEDTFKFLFMDMMVKIPARFFVRGRGLDAEFKGQIRAKGPAHKPVVRGTLSVVRGTYQFLARTFDITEGQIAFDGSSPPTPFLNVSAEVNAGEIDAQVRITGPVDGFTLSLTSQPPLPEDEIMANILFGQSAAKLNPFQAYQLASALAQLSGHDMPDVMGKTRKLLGVDRLTISGGNNGDDDGNEEGPTVEVGKYVSEKVYVGIEQDITDAKQDVVVEVDITPNFSLESKAGTKSGAGLGFSWKYDY